MRCDGGIFNYFERIRGHSMSTHGPPASAGYGTAAAIEAPAITDPPWPCLGGFFYAWSQAVAEPLPDLTVAASGLIGPALSALMGVLMRHSQLVQRGERRFLSPVLLLELPTVAGMGIVGGGLGSYLDLAPSVTWAVAAVLGWLGPQALALLVRAVAQRAGVKIDPDEAAP